MEVLVLILSVASGKYLGGLGWVRGIMMSGGSEQLIIHIHK